MVMLGELSERAACLFFNDTATTEIYTLSLHDALPISNCDPDRMRPLRYVPYAEVGDIPNVMVDGAPSPSTVLADRKEHTSELQSRQYLVCRLLLEKKNVVLLPPLSHFSRSRDDSLILP